MSVDGDWKVTMKSPMGDQDGTLTLKSDSGSLSGTMVTAMGSQEFDGGSMEGDLLKWKVSLKQPMPMDLEFSATVDGDSIRGDVKLGAFGNATFEGQRA